MADGKVRHVDWETQANVDQKFVDLGDGTFAAAVSVEGGVEATITDIDASLDTPPITVRASLVRPADTAPYAAGDVVSDSTGSPTPTVLTFANIVSANGDGGFIVGATLADYANQTTPGDFELWLFDTTVTAMEDNAAFDPADAEIATCIGIIDFLAANSYVGNSGSGASGNRFYPGEIRGQGVIPFTCGVASRSLFGVPVVRNAYTPTSGETFVFGLQTGQR